MTPVTVTESEAMMRVEETLSQESYGRKWWLRAFLGVVLLLVGFYLALSSLFNSTVVIMMAKGFSWLPLSGLIIMLLGFEECVEAYFSRELRELHHNLQVGILDFVVGGLIVLSVGAAPERLVLLIAAFLLVRGFVRMVLVQVLQLPNKLLTSFFGLTAVVLGGLLAFDVFADQAAFVAFAVNLEIAFRGWAMLSFAWWVRNRNQTA
ncbi:MAG: hypothetical protein RQ715_11125 [Methylococcales bacterium]|nr:hypothetical protein [Methylococcales bacterium]